MCLWPCLAGAEGLSLVPPPQSLKLAEGRMPLTARSRIIVADPKLQPLANLLADELELLTGLKLSANNLAQPPAEGDLVLAINANLRADADILAARKEGGQMVVGRCRDFAHTIEIASSAKIEGFDYRAVCEGTATLLQLIATKEGGASLPRLLIKDWPHADYTGTLVDVARQRIPIDTLKAVIEACRVWKLRYCQLHLTDNEAFTFPSTAFPKLGSANLAAHEGETPRVYSLAELRDLVAFADARGVTLVPELATPNHSEAMCRAMPETFAGPKILNLVNDKMYDSLDTLVGEMCDVFASSPFFHIGCEEMYFCEIEEWQPTKDYLQKNGLKNFDEVFVRHVTRMNEMVRKRGKLTLAWENVAIPTEGRAYSLPESLRSQIVPMCWVPWPSAAGLQKQGFTTITVPWDRGESLKTWNLYDCNGDKLDPATAKVLGGAVTMWQMSAASVVSDFLGGDLNGSSTEGYLRAQGNHVTGVWNPTAPVDAAARDQGLAASRAILETLLFPVRITSGAIAYRGWPVVGKHFYNGQSEVRLEPTKPAGTGQIRYTLDGSEPSLQSPLYSAPLTVKETTVVHAAYFVNGKQVGAVSRGRFARLDDGVAKAE